MSQHSDEDPWAFLRYSRLQQLALAVVVLLIFMMGGLQIWSPFSPPSVVFEEDWARYAAEFHQANEPAAPESFFFDPNTVSRDELILLGLKPWVADSWIKYRGNRSDAFRKPEDIRKLYRLDSADAERLLPLVRLATSPAKISWTNEVAKKAYKPDLPESTTASFTFDPNSVSRAELILLGLSEKQANGFINYRAARPPFTRVEELDAIRVLTDKNLRHLKPLVRFSATTDSAPIAANGPANEGPQTYGNSGVSPQPYLTRPEPATIDINRATATDWQSLPGIGPARSGRIMRFREQLGGFYSVAQVGTTYGLPDSTFQKISPYLNLGDEPVEQLKINDLPADSLRTHPYISKKLAEILVNNRRQHGPFRSGSDLARVRILKESDLKRILPYLDFSN